MFRNVRSIELHQKTYLEISWDYPFNSVFTEEQLLSEIYFKKTTLPYDNYTVAYTVQCRINVDFSKQIL
jgi:hypothetical protein